MRRQYADRKPAESQSKWKSLLVPQNDGAEGGSRTPTGFKPDGILNPARLPIPPLRHPGEVRPILQGYSRFHKGLRHGTTWRLQGFGCWHVREHRTVLQDAYGAAHGGMNMARTGSLLNEAASVAADPSGGAYGAIGRFFLVRCGVLSIYVLTFFAILNLANGDALGTQASATPAAAAEDPIMRGLQERGLTSLLQSYLEQKPAGIAATGTGGGPAAAGDDKRALAQEEAVEAETAENVGQREEGFKKARQYYEEAIADAEKALAAAPAAQRATSCASRSCASAWTWPT